MKSFLKTIARIAAALVLLMAVAAGVLFYTFANGPISNEELRARVESQLTSMLGAGLEARMDESSLAIGSGGLLSLTASGVTILRDGSTNLGVADRVRIKIRAWPLLSGDILAEEIVVDGAKIAVSPLLPNLPGLKSETGFVFDWTTKIDVKSIMSAAGNSIADLAKVIDAAGLDSIRFNNVQLVGFDQFGLRMKRARLEELVFQRRQNSNDGLFATGRLVSDHNTLSLTGSWQPGGKAAHVLEMALTGLDMQDVLVSSDAAASGFLQMDSPLTVRLQSPFDERLIPLKATVAVSAGPGRFVLGDDIRTNLSHADISLSLLPEKNQIELEPSPLRFDQTKAVISGGIRFANGPDTKPLFELLANDVVAYTMKAASAGVPGALKISGSIDRQGKRVVADKLVLKTPSGMMNGKAEIDFSQGPANLQLDLGVDSMDVAHFKQFWLPIIAPGAREWANEGIQGGRVRNASLSMKLPAADLWNDAQLTSEQLEASIPIEGAVVKATAALPSISDATGAVDINGMITSIKISGGRLNSGTNGSVTVDTGSLVLQTGVDGTLPADLALKFSGKAAPVAQLGTLQPLNFASRLGLRPSDLSGSVVAGITATFDILKDFDPGTSQWAASVQIRDGASKSAFAGRMITAADLIIEASPASAKIRGSAKIDGLPATLNMIEPLSPGGNTQRTITLSLDAAARKRLGIDTGGILAGTVGVTLSSGSDEKQLVEADLTSATLDFPWIGWTKGKGIRGSAKFLLRQSGKTTTLEGFSLGGKGFSARGTITFDKDGLVAASLKNIRLNRTDDFDVAAKRIRGGYGVTVNARSYDGRAIIRKFLENERGTTGGGKTVTVSGGIDRLTGFNNAVLGGVSIDFIQVGSRVERAVVEAVAAGAAPTSFSLKPVKGGVQTSIYSENAGAVLGFLDLYRKVRGGKLRAKLVRDKSQIFRGTVEAENFTLLDEPRLASLLRPPASSRNTDRLRGEVAKLRAFRNNSASVEQLRANVEKGPGFLKIARGRMQGGDASAAFEGTVYDQRNRMNVRGTFLPGRGLNKLVSNIPLLGLAFGSGKTTGLLGITFRLRGPYGNPQIAVNPLSIIAPGVFRRLFQF